MLVLALALAALLVVGILLAPLGAGIVVVTVVLAVAVVGWAVWGLFWRRSRSVSGAGGGLEHPEFLGPGGPDDPTSAEPGGDGADAADRVSTARR